jgi:hypothetical protein
VDAEFHGELALFNTPEAQPEGGLLGFDHLVGKAVLGSSYTFNVGRGLTVMGEYHYSGFGIRDIKKALARLMDPLFQKRFLRGDSQILGRHALAVQLSMPFTDTWRGGLLILESPVDGSGLAAPSLSWDVAQNVSLRANAFIPWGAEPVGGQLKSEYGASPLSLFLQLNFYY